MEMKRERKKGKEKKDREQEKRNKAILGEYERGKKRKCEEETERVE